LADKPKVEFGADTVSLSLQFDKPAKGGNSKFGPWWIWGVEENGEDKVLFTDGELQGTIESLNPSVGMPLAIKKGKKNGEWKVWTYDGDGWELATPGRTADAPDPEPSRGGPPPAPGAAQKQPTAPTKAPQRGSGISLGEACDVFAASYSRACHILFGGDLTDQSPTECVTQARMLATTLFIAQTDQRSVLPKGYQHAPESAVQKVAGAIDGDVDNSDMPPPPGKDVPAEDFTGDDLVDELPF
jgi:hypothetical protein